ADGVFHGDNLEPVGGGAGDVYRGRGAGGEPADGRPDEVADPDGGDRRARVLPVPPGRVGSAVPARVGHAQAATRDAAAGGPEPGAGPVAVVGGGGCAARRRGGARGGMPDDP